MDVDSARASVEPAASQEPIKRSDSVVRSVSLIESLCISLTRCSAIAWLQPPTPARPSRLKRRVGTTQPSAVSGMFPESADVFMPDTAEEPRHKRYKSLFEQSDPDKVAGMSIDEYGSQLQFPGAESETQYEPSALGAFATTTMQTMGGRSGTSGGLGVVPEEEEESMAAVAQIQSQSVGETQARGTKRKTQSEDVEMDDEDAGPRTKKRTRMAEEEGEAQTETQAQTQQPAQKPMSKVVTRVDMAQSQVHVKPKPESKKQKAQAQASAKGPDRDDAFLKAVASTRRGKKAEDDFDREFNNLRISRPELERQDEEEAYKILEEFGDDGDVRGNFMVVMEMPLFREPGERSADPLRRGEGRLEWQGKADFKKDRKSTRLNSSHSGESRMPSSA